MDTFVPSIKKKYFERRINNEKQWPPCHSSKLIRLQLVKREKGSSSIQRGKDDGTDKELSLTYCDLFKEKGEKRPVRKVLVEGDAGIGKTTLSTSMCEDWSCDKLFQEYELLLLLPLRHKDVATAGSLPELLQLLHSSQDICKSVASYVEEGEGEKVLVIADGWDELSESKRQEESFLYRLLFEKFPLMSVVVTSRPSASGPLHRLPCIDRFVEIKGFSEEDIKEYIRSEFPSDEKKAGDLLEQLESNPLVESICSVPLNCAIVCHLWRCLKESLPTTMTQLYKKIILSVIFRNIQKKHAYKVSNLSDFNALPCDLKPSFQCLCEFAFQALENNRIVFSQDELVKFFPLSQGLTLDEKILCFGLLQSSEIVLEAGHGASFHFLHLTFQEYLAALHLSNQSKETQLEVFQSHCSQAYHLNPFLMVWRFFFGICFGLQKVDSKQLQQAIQCLAHKMDGHTVMSICHCAYEAHNEGVIREVIKSVGPYFAGGTVYPRTAHDIAALLYVIAHLEDCSDMKFYLGWCGMKEAQATTLTDTLASKNGKLKVESLLVIGNHLLTDKCVGDLFSRASAAFHSLMNLDLANNRLSGECISPILSALTNSFTNVACISRLNLSLNQLGLSGLQALKSAVQANLLSNLLELKLYRSLTGDAQTNASWLFDFLQTLSCRCPKLESFNFSENNLGTPGAQALGTAISILYYHMERGSPLNIDFLDCLNLNQTCLGEEGLIAFVDSLENIPHYFHSLKLNNNSISGGIIFLTEAIAYGKIALDYVGADDISLNELDLSDNPLGLEHTEYVGMILSCSFYCQSPNIDLSRCKLATSTTASSAPSEMTIRDVGLQLCQMNQNDSITSLDLDGNNFTGEGIHILAGFLHLCPNLDYLSSRDCGLNSNDILHLLDKLTQFNDQCSTPRFCKKLNQWHLRDNDIDDSGAIAIIDHLPSLFPSLHFFFPNVCGVELSNTRVSSKTKKRLEEAVKRQEPFKLILPSQVNSSTVESASALEQTNEHNTHSAVAADNSPELRPPSPKRGCFMQQEPLEAVHPVNAAPQASDVPTSSDQQCQDDDGAIHASLMVDDLASVQRVVWEGRAKWDFIGLELGLSPGTLDATKLANQGDPDRCLMETLKKWLSSPELHPSWSRLAEALRSPTVGMGDLADKIK